MRNMEGFQPELRELVYTMANAMSGDIVMSITPATVVQIPTAAAWTRTVLIEIKDSKGRVHDWLNEDFATTLSIANTSTAGTASIASTTLAIRAGKASVVVSGDAEAWLNTETNTLTVGDITVLGTTVTGGTSVGTFTTPA